MSRAVMPIMSSPFMSEIPFAMIAPHEKQAQRNHWQSLDRLAERGGLSACEALAILEDRPWARGVSKEDDARLLINKVREWRAALAAPSTRADNQTQTKD